MVVDDEKKNHLIMESLLEPQGHKLTYATSGSQALEMLRANPPDLILLDVLLPDMDGFRVCKLLKSNEDTRLIPVILITSLNEVSNRVQAFDCDAEDFISKPVNRHELTARIRSCLRIKALNDRLERSESVLYAFARAVEAKDPYTIGHSERVSTFAADLGCLAALPPDRISELRRGGLLHDIGKIGIPDHILG